MSAVSGHVFRYEGKRRPVWRAKYRLPDGRQVAKDDRAGVDRARSFAGGLLDQAHRRSLAPPAARRGGRRNPSRHGRTDATVAAASAEYLRYVDQDRQRKPATMAAKVAEALARLGQREHFTELLRHRRRPLRFHDLRHAFGTRVIGVADIRRVQERMGHANVQTTMQCLHYVPRPQDAALVGRGFEPSPPDFEESGQGRLL